MVVAGVLMVLLALGLICMRHVRDLYCRCPRCQRYAAFELGGLTHCIACARVSRAHAARRQAEGGDTTATGWS